MSIVQTSQLDQRKKSFVLSEITTVLSLRLSVCLFTYLDLGSFWFLKILPFWHLPVLPPCLELNWRGGVRVCSSGCSQSHTSSAERSHQRVAEHEERAHQRNSLLKWRSGYFSEAQVLSIWSGRKETFLDIFTKHPSVEEPCQAWLYGLPPILLCSDIGFFFGGGEMKKHWSIWNSGLHYSWSSGSESTPHSTAFPEQGSIHFDLTGFLFLRVEQGRLSWDSITNGKPAGLGIVYKSFSLESAHQHGSPPRRGPDS